MNCKIIMLLLILGFILAGTSAGYSREWYNDTELAMCASEEQKKPMMWMFSAKWCGYCQQMESGTFIAPKVSYLLDNFICVKLDYDENKMFAESCCNVAGIPTFIFYDLRGNVVERFTGYKNPSDFAGILEDVLAKAGL